MVSLLCISYISMPSSFLRCLRASIWCAPSKLLVVLSSLLCRTVLRIRYTVREWTVCKILCHNLCIVRVLDWTRYRRLVVVVGTRYPAHMCPLPKTHCCGPLLRPVVDPLVSRSVLLKSAPCLERCRWPKRPLKLDLSH